MSSSHRVGVIESRSGANALCSRIVALIAWCSKAAQSPGSSTITEADQTHHHFELLASCSSRHAFRVRLLASSFSRKATRLWHRSLPARTPIKPVSEGHLGSLALESLANGLKVMKLIEKKVNNVGSTDRRSPDQCQSISRQSERLRGSI